MGFNLGFKGLKVNETMELVIVLFFVTGFSNVSILLYQHSQNH